MKNRFVMITQKPYAVKIMNQDTALHRWKGFKLPKLDSTQRKKVSFVDIKKVRLFMTKAQGRADSLSFNETDGILH